MKDIESDINALKRNPNSVRFAELSKILDRWFGTPRRTGGSHRVYRTPWRGDPRLNIQDANGMAKAYQVRQAIQALERLGEQRHPDTGRSTESLPP